MMPVLHIIKNYILIKEQSEFRGKHSCVLGLTNVFGFKEGARNLKALIEIN